MKPKEIKIILLDKDLSVSKLAVEFGCRRQELSMCINQAPRRVYPELRRKLARRLKMPVATLFDNGLASAKGRTPKGRTVRA